MRKRLRDMLPLRLRTCALLFLMLGLIVYESPDARATCAVGSSYAAFAHETITVSTTAVGFNSALYDQAAGQATAALVSVETNAIRFFSDGTINPTASVGHPLAAASSAEVCGFANVKNWRMIRQSADATVTVSYFR